MTSSHSTNGGFQSSSSPICSEFPLLMRGAFAPAWSRSPCLRLRTTSAEIQAQNILDYIGDLIAERRAHHHDDLLGRLVAACDEGERLSEVELVSMVNSLIVGGFETTASQLGSTVYTLLSQREAVAGTG